MVQNIFEYVWEIRNWDFGCPDFYLLQGQMVIALKVFLEIFKRTCVVSFAIRGGRIEKEDRIIIPILYILILELLVVLNYLNALRMGVRNSTINFSSIWSGLFF